ncbi:DNA-binding transcriptional regulator [Myceligenerans halotolerans]
MASERTRHVALLIETSNAYARALLTGVHRYAEDRGGWSMYLGEHSRQETDFSWLDGWRGDGVLARIENKATAQIVQRLGLPTVDLSAARLLPALPGVETDDDTIARWAVEHFEQRGLRHFAYCGDHRFAWALKRGAWFAEHVRRRGLSSHEFQMVPSGRRAADRARLAGWLAELPRPVGVLACYDIAGQEVLEACTIAGLAVPDEVAVVGVDNDELIAGLTSPPLSSIEPGAVRMGHLAARLLDKIMNGEPIEPGLRLIDPIRVVTRQSSDVLAVDDPIVVEALRFIRDNADKDIKVGAVLREVGLSRRALDHRFGKLLGRSVHAEITRVRMARVADMLSSTDWTLPRIADRLSFKHSEYMSVAFKKYTGSSPGAYRRTVNKGVALPDADPG